MTDLPEKDWRGEFREIWNELVPDRGRADSYQGELVRCIGRITDEAYRNGNENWNASFEEMLNFLKETLPDSRVFSEGEVREIERCIDSIGRDVERPDLSGPTSTYYFIASKCVAWCQHFHERVPLDDNENYPR